MRRLFFPFSGDEFILTGETFHHLIRVYRAKVGNEMEFADGRGRVVKGKITEITESEAMVKIVCEVELKNEAPIEVVLGIGLLKGEKMDWVIQKAVELGVSAIIPLAMENSVVKLDEKKRLSRRDRWQKIVQEAAQQSGRDYIPTVHLPMQLKEMLGDVGPNAEIWVPYEGNAQCAFKTQLVSRENVGRNYIVIGPEGGFSDLEIETLKSNGAHIVTLGPRILRAETAALAALTILLSEWGDLGGVE